MEKLIRKITNIAIIAIAGIAGLFGLYVMLKSGVKDTIAMDTTFYLMYLLVLIGVALIIIFGVLQIISSKKQMITTLVIAVVAVATFLVCYLMSSTELSEVAQRVGISKEAYQWVGASLNLAYVMFVGLILTFLGMYVYTKIKNR